LLQPVENFLLSFVADAAGVIENEFRFFRAFDLRIAVLQKRAHDLFRIVGIHLAAERFYVKLLHFACLTASRRLSVQKVHYPTDAEQRDDEVSETLQAVTQPFTIGLLGHHSEHGG
jgi:hypothetical protein